MKNEFVIIGAYNDYVEASIVKEKLISEEIYAFLGDENIIAVNPLYSLATGGVKVYVRFDDELKARDLLRSSEAEYKKTLICEACGYDKVSFISSRKDLNNYLSLIIAFILNIFPFYQKKVYRCERCGYETDFLM